MDSGGQHEAKELQELSPNDIAGLFQTQAKEISQIWTFFSVVALGVLSVLAQGHAGGSFYWAAAGLWFGGMIFAAGSCFSLRSAQKTLHLLAERANSIWIDSGHATKGREPFKALSVRTVTVFHILLSAILVQCWRPYLVHQSAEWAI